MGNIHILVVDDDRIIRKMLDITLRSEGCKVPMNKTKKSTKSWSRPA